MATFWNPYAGRQRRCAGYRNRSRRSWSDSPGMLRCLSIVFVLRTAERNWIVGTTAEQLAERFERANEASIALAVGCSEAEWRAVCVAEGWSVGVTVHHVAADYADLLAVIEAMAAGGPAPVMTRELLERRNVEHAQRFAGCTKRRRWRCCGGTGRRSRR